MATRYAVASGNWSSTSTWDGGTLPTSADDVFANNFTVTIDQNVTVLSIRTTSNTTPSITNGGSFTLAGAYTVNATSGGILGGTAATCVNVSVPAGTTAAITAAAMSTTATNSAYRIIEFSGAGTLNLNCAIIRGGGSSGNVVGVAVSGGGTLIATGEVRANSLSNTPGIVILTTNNAIVTINGSVVTSSSANSQRAMTISVPATVTITGNITPGTSAAGGNTFGIEATAAATINVGGSLLATADIGNNRALSVATGSTVNITGSITSGYGPGIECSGALTLAVQGSVTSGVSAGISVGAASVVNVTGSVSAGSSAGAGVLLAGNNITATFQGDLRGGTNAAGHAVSLTSGSGYAITVNGVIQPSNGAGNGISITSTGGGTLQVNNPVTGGVTSGGHGIAMTTGCTATIVGAVTGGAGSGAAGVSISGGTSSLTITGNVTTDALTINGNAISYGTANPTINITGNVLGGTLATAISGTTGAPTMTITGNVTAKTVDAIAGTTGNSVINVAGTITAGNGGVGVSSTASGAAHSITVSGPLYNYFDTQAVHCKRLLFASGSTPVWTAYMQVGTGSERIDRQMRAVQDMVGGVLPATTDVRSGTVYGPTSEFTGTLETGGGSATDIAAAVWNYARTSATTAGSMGERLKDASTVSTTGAQIASFGT